MTFQLHLSIKLMVKILLNENTTGKIPSKCWHAMALMLKMISIITAYLYLYFHGTMYWPITYYYCSFYCGCYWSFY